ncbi:MAG: hypothetical protein ACLVL7_11445 [Anaerotruncus massiliensis (ex Togo et al. 2019)]
MLLVLGILAFLLLRAPRVRPRAKAALAGQPRARRRRKPGGVNRSEEGCPISRSTRRPPLNGKAEGLLQIETCRATGIHAAITLDDTGELIYEWLIEFNHHIQSAKLDGAGKGRIPATAVFNAYDLETEEYMGRRARN